MLAGNRRDDAHAEHASPKFGDKYLFGGGMERRLALRKIKQLVVHKVGSHDADSDGKLVERHEQPSAAWFCDF